MNSARFYDQYLKQQIESGINDRIAALYERTLKAGLVSGSTVLEIGCGIGTLTYLLSRTVSTGRIEATDISPLSVQYAEANIKKSNIQFFCGDILESSPQQPPFDFILLFDVLEHIPLGRHAQLFGRISGWMHEHSLLLINIPNPGYILYDQLHNPSALQELDQPLYLTQLAAVIEQAGLELLHFETWSAWVKEDYQFMIVRKRKAFTEQVLSKERNLLQKGRKWMGRKWRKMKYRYPPG